MPPPALALNCACLFAAVRCAEVYEEIRKLLQSYIAEEHLDAAKQEEVLAELRSAGLFGDATGGAVGPQVGFGYEAHAAATAAAAGSHGAAVSTHSLVGGGRLVPGKRYLSVRLKGGRAFVDNLIDDAEARTGGLHVLRVSVELLGSRCVSVPVPATVEPHFDENFLFQLQDEERESEVMMPLEQLAEVSLRAAHCTALVSCGLCEIVIRACRSVFSSA